MENSIVRSVSYFCFRKCIFRNSLIAFVSVVMILPYSYSQLFYSCLNNFVNGKISYVLLRSPKVKFVPFDTLSLFANIFVEQNIISKSVDLPAKKQIVLQFVIVRSLILLN